MSNSKQETEQLWTLSLQIAHYFWRNVDNSTRIMSEVRVKVEELQNA